MPLLKREADAYPDELFDLPVESFPWWVLQVRSRQEKLVARFLQQERAAYFLPQMEKKTRKNGRTFTSFLPLFPGYVFYRGPKSSHERFWRNGGIIRALPVEDQERLDRELRQLHRLQTEGLALVPHPYVAAGDEVTITDGVFAGYRGLVTREKGAMLLIVSVSVIHHSVAVELQRDAVIPVEPAPRAG